MSQTWSNEPVMTIGQALRAAEARDTTEEIIGSLESRIKALEETVARQSTVIDHHSDALESIESYLEKIGK